MSQQNPEEISKPVPISKKFSELLRKTGISPSAGYYPGLRAGYGFPIFYIGPISRETAKWHAKQGSKCADFEMDYYRCASRVGLRPVQKGEQCLHEFEDLKECITHGKSLRRKVLMDKERRKQKRKHLEEPAGYSEVKMPNEDHVLRPTS